MKRSCPTGGCKAGYDTGGKGGLYQDYIKNKLTGREHLRQSRGMADVYQNTSEYVSFCAWRVDHGNKGQAEVIVSPLDSEGVYRAS